MAPNIEKLLANTKKIDTGCWIWQGAIRSPKNPYGCVNLQGVVQYVHHLVYEAFKGPRTRGKVIMHSCNVPLCCNPEHLNEGTHTENTAQMLQQGRHSSGDLDKKRWAAAKLTKTEIQEIKEALKNYSRGMQVRLANKYKVNSTIIHRIQKGTLWKDV